MKQPTTLREYIAKLIHQSRNPIPMKTAAVNKLVNILFALIMLPICVSAGVLAKQAVNKLMNRDRLNERTTQPQASGTWLRYKLSGVSVDSPLSFVRDSNLEQLILAPYKEFYNSIEVYCTPREQANYVITVVHGVTKPHVNYNIDLGAAGAIRMATAEAGDHNPQYTCTPVRVSGLNARQVTYRGKIIYADMVIVATAHEYWQLGVYRTPSSDSDHTITSRIINSMIVTP